MKVCIIYGNERKGNTYNAVQVVKKKLAKEQGIEFIEYTLPRDMPDFCLGCFNCFYHGKEKCPHSKYTMRIYDSFKEADGIIFASPVYVMGESAQMKALLDHFGHMYIVHNPMEEMFKKSVLLISTTAGAGTKYPMDTIQRSVKSWGVSKIYRCGMAVRSKSWDEIEEQRKLKFIKKLETTTNKFYNSLGKKSSPSLFVRIMFNVFVKVHNSSDALAIEKKYWSEKGWLNGKRPWK